MKLSIYLFINHAAPTLGYQNSAIITIWSTTMLQWVPKIKPWIACFTSYKIFQLSSKFYYLVTLESHFVFFSRHVKITKYFVKISLIAPTLSRSNRDNCQTLHSNLSFMDRKLWKSLMIKRLCRFCVSAPQRASQFQERTSRIYFRSSMSVLQK